MPQMLFWLALCSFAALALQRRPLLILGTVLVLRLAVPSTAGWLLVGDWQGNAAIHPSIILLLIWAPLALLGHSKEFATELRAWPGTYFALMSVVAFFTTVAIVQSGVSSLLGLTNSLLSAILFFFTLRVLSRSEPRLVPNLLRLFLVAISFEAGLTVFQWAIHANLPWSLVLDFSLVTRPLGTFDSPLDLGLACAVAIPLLANVRKPLLRYSAMILLLFGVLLSESRAPTLIALAGVAYLVLIAIRSARSFIAMASLVVLGAALIVSTSLLSGIAARFAGDDGNSVAARNVATDYIVDHLSDVLIVGNGWGSSYELKGTILPTSLENGYAILAFDLGGFAVALLILVQLRISLTRGSIAGAWLAGLFCVIGGLVYSGITTMSAISIVIWTVMAFCREGAKDRAQVRQNAQPPASGWSGAQNGSRWNERTGSYGGYVRGVGDQAR